MRPTVNQAIKLPFSQKISRLSGRLKDPQWRRYGMILLAGKVLGVAVVMLIAGFVTELCFTKVFAADRRGEGGRYRESGEHRLDSDRGVPGVWYAGGLHDAGGRLLPFARDR